MEVEIINRIWPEWKVEKKLGQGSYGTVYKAVRTDGGVTSESAIKLIVIPQDSSEIDSLFSEGMTVDEAKTYFKSTVNNFVSEIKLMESFKGIQNIVSIEDYKVVENEDGKELGWCILVRMELLTPFDKYIRDHTLDEDEIIRLGCDICSALDICSQKNIIHRDIKPENIFINDFGFFKLGDFGIAKQFDNLQASHSQKGTYNYMAPEVAHGTHYDLRVDICSLGLVLYRLANNNMMPFLTEENRLDPSARREALDKRLSGETLPPPSGCSAALAEVILRACAYNPDDRFSSAKEFKKALEQVKYGVYVLKGAASAPVINHELNDGLDETVSVNHASGSQIEDLTVSVLHQNGKKDENEAVSENKRPEDTEASIHPKTKKQKDADKNADDTNQKYDKSNEKKENKTRSNKWIIILLILLLVLGAGAFLFIKSESKIKYQKDGDGYSAKAGLFYKSDDVLVIPDEYNELPITKISAKGFANHKEIKSIVIPSSVIEISGNAFADCIHLEEVSFSENLTSIGEKAFFNTALSQIEMPAGISKIGSSAFDNCQSLSSVNFGERESTPAEWINHFSNNQNTDVLVKTQVVFDADEVDNKDAVSDMYIEYGKQFSLPVPSRSGYAFEGWYNQESQKITDEKGDSVSECAFPEKQILSPKWVSTVKQEYRISFDGNHSTSGEIKQIAFFFGDEVVLPGNSFSRDGYSFAGWAETPTGEIILSDKEAFVPESKKDVTLYAVWTANTNKLIFNGNGSSAGSMNEIEAKTGQTIELPKNEYSRSGYIFTGWSKTPDGTAAYNDKGSFTVGTETAVNFYAVWSANTNKLVFNGNGSSTGSMNAVEAKTGQTIELPKNEYSRSGYLFAGWSKKQDGPVDYNDGESFSMGTDKSVTLYAVWVKGAYLITYDLNGGSVVDNVYAYDYDTPTFKINNPTKAGFDFIGWSGTGISNPEMNLSVPTGSTGNRAYKANWKAKTNVLNFDSNGGNGTMQSQSAATGESVRLAQNAFTKDGWYFVGWSTMKGGEARYADGSNYTMSSEPKTTLYAVWKHIEFSIRYDLDGGGKVSNATTYNVDTPSFKLNNPTRDGFSFIGWTGTGLSGLELDVLIPSGSTGNREYKANWSEITSLLQFDPNGGSGVMQPQTIRINRTVALPQNTFVKEGYQFKGWSKTPNGSVLYYDQGSIAISGDEPITLYAIWSANNNSIVFVPNGGTGSMPNQIIKTDEQAKLNSNKFSRSGYSFAGWATSSDGTVQYADCDTYVMGASSENKLYAVWAKGAFTITYYLDGGTVPDNVNAYDVETPSFTINNPVKQGYSFTGWSGTNISGQSTNVSIAKGSTGNRTYYAHWAPNINEIRFHANGGSGTMTSMNAATDETVTLAANKFYNEGYDFCGWALSSAGEVKYNDTASFAIGTDSAYDLYAVWKAKQIKVTFLTNGGNTIGTQSLPYLSSITVTPVREGYTFGGWFADADLSIKIETVPNNDISLYAWWKEETKPSEFKCTSNGWDMYINKYLGSKSTVVIPSKIGDKPVTEIKSSAFEYCNTVTSVVVPNGVTGIGQRAFKNSSLCSITLPTSLKTIEQETFSNCESLAKINSNENGHFVLPEGLESIKKNAFSWCSMATDIVVPNSVTYIERCAFSCMSNIEKMTLPFLGESRTSNGKNGQLGSFFADYSMYTQDSVVNNSVPLELTEIVLTDADRIGTNAFLGCKMLQSISINNGVESIGTGAFQGCKGLSTIVIPDSVVTIGSAVFKECDNLETVFLSSNITSIEKESFIGCTKLRGVNSETALVISSKVTYIGDQAFWNCESLTQAIIPENVTLGTNPFFGCGFTY